MAAIKWSPGVTLDVDPDAVLDYSLDFTTYLEGNTIANAVAIPEGCDANVQLQDDNSVRFRASNFAAKCSATIRITMADGQSDDFTLKFKAKNR